MSEARSLTALSETDYLAIEAAVMETARGRWFMAEFAKRNRQADTLQLLGALNRIERVVGVGMPAPTAEPDIGEAAALIADLRIDLERISGKAEARASGLAARIETAASTIGAATESVQEIAWNLREAGASEALCDLLDQRTVEISAAGVVVDGTVQQLDKIADTIAMLDSSLRAVGGRSLLAPEAEAFTAPLPTKRHIGARDVAAPLVAPLAARDLGSHDLGSHDLGTRDLSARDGHAFDGFDAIEIVELDDIAPAAATGFAATGGYFSNDPHPGSIPDPDDIAFREPTDSSPEASISEPAPLSMPQERKADDPRVPLTGLALVASEAAMRDLDGLSTTRKLAYFA